MKATKFTRETIRDIGVTERNFPVFGIGSTIAISLKIKEAEKERIQTFEGTVIGMKKNGISSTFTVRKIGANAVSVERTFPYYSPVIDSIKHVRDGKIRRAKLYFLRDRVGKAGEVERKVLTKEQKDAKRAIAK